MRSWMGVNIFFARDSGVVAVIKFEQVVTSTDIFSIIGGKFRYWQQPCPIILLPIDKCSEVRLRYTILPLCLAICLSVESYK